MTMQKTEVPGIYKKSEGVLVNADNDALLKYKRRRDSVREKDNKINNLESKVDHLTQELEQLKSLLLKMVEK